MLSDDIINTLQNMLNRGYPNVKDLQDPVLGQALQFKIINESVPYSLVFLFNVGPVFFMRNVREICAILVRHLQQPFKFTKKLISPK